MVSWFSSRVGRPIGVDLGSRSIKMLQLSSDGTHVRQMARWDLPSRDEGDADEHDAQLSDALRRIRAGRKFRGRDAVICLGHDQLVVQSVRVAKQPFEEMQQNIQAEAGPRLPFPVDEAEIRFVDAADVHHGEVTKREFIVLACHRPVLDRALRVVERAGLQPVAVDAEPTALLRCFAAQFRRDDDQKSRHMFVHMGASNTIVLIARGDSVLFVKYLDVSGRQMDESVARHLRIELADASALRRHNGDRRTEQRDPEIERSVHEAIRPMIEKLGSELSLCIRYHSVAFRGGPLERLVLSGGEANTSVMETLASRLDLRCELMDPLRSFKAVPDDLRNGQWDLVTGLALRESA